MADIFISYSSQDRELAKTLADKLALQGHSVWWDTNLAPGGAFRPTILKELEEATRVFVIWSRNSVKSEWVISEAERAAKANKLVPLRTPDLDIHEIPPPFDQRHTLLISEYAAASAITTNTSSREKTPDLFRRGLGQAFLILSGLWFLLVGSGVVQARDNEFYIVPVVIWALFGAVFAIFRGVRPR